MNARQIAEAAQRYMLAVEPALRREPGVSHRELRDAERELNALIGVALADQPAATETGPEICECPHCSCNCKRCNGFGDDEVRAETAPQGAPYSYAIGAGGGDDGCSACGAGQHETCKADCSAAPHGAPQCPDCDQTGRHMCEGRRQVVEPQGAPPKFTGYDGGLCHHCDRRREEHIDGRCQHRQPCTCGAGAVYAHLTTCPRAGEVVK